MTAQQQAPMHYSEMRPAPRHLTWVAYYWHFRVDPGAGDLEHWVPPDGGVMALYGERDRTCRVVGPYLQPYQTEVRAGDLFWGVRFWPGAASALLPIDPGEIRNRGILLETVHPEWATRMTTRLRGQTSPEKTASVLDEILDLLHPPRRPLDPPVMTGVFRILRSQGREPIASVAAAAGLSPSQFRRRFRRAVGLTPKELARIRRFRETAIDVVTETLPEWVDLAAEHGYADQAHLVHEFRRLIGLAPETFRSRFRLIEHGRLFRRGRT